MARQELEILLRSKADNAGFKAIQQAAAQTKAAAAGLGTTFAQQAAAFDGVTNAQLRAFAGLSSMASQSKLLWVSLAAAPAAVATGIAAVATAVYQLGQRGSEIQGVKTSFDQLTASIGGASQFLTAARGATKGLLTDYALMQNANRLLGAQIPVTGAQFGEMARQAIALGRSVGKAAAESVDRLAMGLSKLEGELLDEINVKVSATDAAKAYAEAHNKSVKDLSAYERQLAFVVAVQEQMRDRTRELGDVQITFADRVTIGTNAIKNQIDNLALAISLSPGLAAGMDRISSAILNAFGGDQQRAIQTLVQWVDWFAIGTMKAAEVIVSAAKVAMQAWSGFQVLFAGVAQGISSGLATIVGAQGKIFEFLAIANPLLSSFYTTAANGARDLAKELDLTGKAWGLAGKMAQESGYQTYKEMTTLEEGIAGVRKEMEEASKKGTTAAAIQRALASTTTEHGKAAGLTAKEIAALKKEHADFLKAIGKQNDMLGLTNAEIKWFTNNLKAFRVNLMPLPLLFQMTERGTEGWAEKLGTAAIRMEGVKQKSHDMGAAVEDAMEQAAHATKRAADEAARLKEELGDFNARQIIGVADAIARGFSGAFGNILSGWVGLFDQMIAASKKNGGKLWEFMQSSGGQRLAGGLQVGFESFSQGYQFGQGLGKGKGALAGAGSGAATGALIGTYVMPGLGTAGGAIIGGIAGGIGGYFGGKKKEKEEKAALADLQKELLKTYGGMDKLRSLAKSVGVDIDRAFSSKKPADALRVINQFSDALDKQKAKIEGINMATEGLNLRALAGFGGNLQELLDTNTSLQRDMAEAFKAGDTEGIKRLQQELDAVKGKLVAIGATGEAEFNRIATYAAASFAAQVQETGNVVDALAAIEPTLAQLKTAQEAFGFAGSETINRLLGFRDIANANRDVFDSLSGLTQMMKGFGDAGLITRDLFQTFASDAAAQFQTLTGRGVDANQALALMAPTLQQLYEGQSKYGAITDETTLQLLEQAKQQGLVGDHMKSTNAQILDAVLGVKDAIVELVGYLRGDVPAAAATAAQGIERAFKDTSIRIPITYEGSPDEPLLHTMPYPYQGGGEYPGYATGGTIPFTPGGRLIRVAERGTEHVVPDAQMRDLAASTVSLTFNISGDAARDPEAVTGAIRNDAVPAIIRAVAANKNGARTNLRIALGVN